MLYYVVWCTYTQVIRCGCHSWVCPLIIDIIVFTSNSIYFVSKREMEPNAQELKDVIWGDSFNVVSGWITRILISGSEIMPRSSPSFMSSPILMRPWGYSCYDGENDLHTVSHKRIALSLSNCDSIRLDCKCQWYFDNFILWCLFQFDWYWTHVEYCHLLDLSTELNMAEWQECRIYLEFYVHRCGLDNVFHLSHERSCQCSVHLFVRHIEHLNHICIHVVLTGGLP